MYFSEFAEYLIQIEKEASRNKKTEILSDLLKKLSKEEVKPVSYLLNGRVAPVFIPIEYNFSLKLMQRAFSKFKPEAEISTMYSEFGDVGLVAEKIFENKPNDIHILDVFNTLKEIALLQGKGSQDLKIQRMVELLGGLSATSAKYVTRMVIGKVRLGLNYRTVLDALSWAIKGDKSLRSILDRAHGVRSDLGEIALIALYGDSDDLETIEATVGLPMASKLVEREKSIESLFQRLGDCIVQPKYDGLRAQIHFSRAGIDILEKNKLISTEQSFLDNTQKLKVAIYSRNMESLTDMFPDVVQKIQEEGIESIILDSEVIGYDEKTDKFLPFQETIQRRRKYGVSDKVKDIPIKVIIFDILYLNGEDLTNKPLVNRLEILKKAIKENIMLKISESIHVKSAEELSDKFQEYMAKNLEGLIAKNKESIYEPGTRNYEWIKLKVRTEAGSVDSLDLVMLGYYNGTGVRAKFGIGALLAGIYDKANDRFLGITKIGTGITDEAFGTIKSKLDELKINSKLDNVFVPKLLYPDVWVEPKIVGVVEFDEITKSKNYAVDGLETGFSIRFPRLKEFGRDKGPTDATTIDEVKKMFDLQFSSK